MSYPKKEKEEASAPVGKTIDQFPQQISKKLYGNAENRGDSVFDRPLQEDIHISNGES
jgi:hypothetical protein